MTNKQKIMRQPMFIGEPFEIGVSLLIALIAIIAAFTAYLEMSASDNEGAALLEAQQKAIQAVGVRAAGEIEAGYAWADAYQHWLEWDTRLSQAITNNSFASELRYIAVRDHARSLSPLLQEPYFDPETGERPNLQKYKVDRYLVTSIRLEEEVVAANQLASSWGDKSGDYVTQLLLFALALFLLGLSTTFIQKIGYIFFAMGLVLSIMATGWMGYQYTNVPQPFSEKAIDFYAKGKGWALQNDYEQAIQAFDQAIALEPTYAVAYFERATAHVGQKDYESAVDDYLLTIQHEHSGAAPHWNLGWVYYLLGQMDEAIATTQTAIQADEHQVALRFNHGLMHLVQGDIDQAIAIYQQGIEMAQTQVAGYAARSMENANSTNASPLTQIAAEIPFNTTGQAPPATFWWYLNAASVDLDNLVACLRSQTCDGSPTYATIKMLLADQANDQSTRQATSQSATVDTILAQAEILRTHLKNTTVWLEYGHTIVENTERSQTKATPTVTNAAFEIIEHNNEEQLADSQSGSLGGGQGGGLGGGQGGGLGGGQGGGLGGGSGLLPSRGALVAPDNAGGQGVQDAFNVVSTNADVASDVTISLDYTDFAPDQVFLMKVYRDGTEATSLRQIRRWGEESSGTMIFSLAEGRQFALPAGKYHVEMYVDAQLIYEDQFDIESEEQL
ncbi:MAG: tetratricopeptide repeat protein [Chloroflexota bacterium]